MDKLRAARKAEEAQKAKRIAALAAEGADEEPAKELEPLVTFIDRMFCASLVLRDCLVPAVRECLRLQTEVTWIAPVSRAESDAEPPHASQGACS